jgi:hypothetical protein
VSAYFTASVASAAAEPVARSLTLRGALLVALAVAFGLALLAFWPAGAWAPPPRPGLKAPVVFDELLPPPVAPTEPTTPDSRAH